MQRAAIADVRLAQNDVTFNCSNSCLLTALRRDPTFFTKVIGDQSCVQKSESLRACACVLFFLCPPPLHPVSAA